MIYMLHFLVLFHSSVLTGSSDHLKICDSCSSSFHCVTIINAFILFCQCKLTIVNVIFSYMLVKIPSGDHFLAYAVCDPEIRLKKKNIAINWHFFQTAITRVNSLHYSIGLFC